MRWYILGFVMSGVFLSTMDSGMLNVALPSIMRSFGMSLEYTELVVTVYLFTITSSLVFWGRLADRIGRGVVYITGIGCFCLGAFACFLATGFLTLLLFRVVQALGASMMMSSGPAIIKESFPPEDLGRSLGLVGIATACGLLAGPVVSGIIVEYYHWNGIFLVSSIIGFLVLNSGIALFRRHLPSSQQQTTRPFDWVGGLCWVGAALSIVALLHQIDKVWSVTSAGLLVCTVILVVLFLKIEKKAKHPIVPLPLFKPRYYWTAVATSSISFSVLFSVLVLIPFYLEYILSLPVDRVGIIMMSVPATLMVLSPLSGYLYNRLGAKILTSFGLFVCFLAILGLGGLRETSSTQYVASMLALLGAGQSIFLSPNSASVLSKVDDEYLGISSGILATARNFGMVAGATLTATLFSLLFGHFSAGQTLVAYTSGNMEAFLAALRVSFMALSGLSLLAVCISFMRD